MKEIIFVLVLFYISQSQPMESNQDLTRTFKFAENLKIAKETAKNESKPIMIIVHSSTCPACARILPRLVESEDMKLASENFILVNACDQQDPEALSYVPADKYVPRIIFLGCNGDELSITNAKQRKCKYYYTKAKHILNSMNDALEVNHELKCGN